MKELLEKVDRTQDQILDRLTAIEKVVVKQEVNIAEHMRRTDAVETLVKKQESKIKTAERVFYLAVGAVSVRFWPVIKEFLKVLL